MQRLREKLAMSDRTAKAEAQLKVNIVLAMFQSLHLKTLLLVHLDNLLCKCFNQEKLKLRMKTLEEGLKHVSSFNPNLLCRSPKPEKSSNFLGFLTSNGGLGKRSTSQPRATIGRSSPLKQPNSDNETANAAGQLKRSNSLKKKYGSGEHTLRKGLWACRSKVIDNGEVESTEMKANNDTDKNDDKTVAAETKATDGGSEDSPNKVSTNCDGEDMVSGFLYDRLQKEVLNLRKHCEAKESDMNAKDQEIKVVKLEN